MTADFDIAGYDQEYAAAQENLGIATARLAELRRLLPEHEAVSGLAWELWQTMKPTYLASVLTVAIVKLEEAK